MTASRDQAAEEGIEFGRRHRGSSVFAMRRDVGDRFVCHFSAAFAGQGSLLKTYRNCASRQNEFPATGKTLAGRVVIIVIARPFRVLSSSALRAAGLYAPP